MCWDPGALRGGPEEPRGGLGARSHGGLREGGWGPLAPGGCCVPVRPGPADPDFPAHREFRHKSNITFNDNDTVSFLEYRSFQFQPDRSHGLESDYIVMPNILVLVRLPRAVPPPPQPSSRSLRVSVSLLARPPRRAVLRGARLSAH